MKDFFQKHLGVYPSERSSFFKAALLFLLIYFFFTIFRNYVDASFLKRYGPGKIPLMLCISGVLSIVLFAFCRRLGRFSHKSVLTGILLACALAQAVIYPFAAQGAPLASPVLYVLLSVMDALLLVYLWNYVQNIFDARQGKRVFRLFMAAQVLGGTLGSLMCAPLTMHAGPDSALAVCAGGNLVLALVLGLSRQTANHAPQTAENPATGAYAAFRAFGRYPIYRFLCVCAVLPNLILPILTYQFGTIAAAAFTSEHELLAFLGWFRGGLTLSVFIFITLLGSIYTRLSARDIALAAPANQCLAFGAMAMFFNLKAAAYAQFSSIFLQRAALGPLTKQLYALLPKDISAWSQVFARGTLTQFSTLGGALLILSLKTELSPRQMSFLSLILAVVWTIETFRFRKSYGAGLKQVIAENRFDFDRFDAMASGVSGEAPPSGPSMEPEEYPEEIFELLEGLDIPELDPDEALANLSSPCERVRAEAAASFALSRDYRAVTGLLDLLSDVEAVRRAAVDSLYRYCPGIIPILEQALIERPAHVQRGILDVLRLARAHNVDVTPFLGKKLGEAYNALIAARALEAGPAGPAVELLIAHLSGKKHEDLFTAFLALWVLHKDMRAIFDTLNSREAAAAAEWLETSLDPWTAALVVPLVDSIPEDAAIARGRQVLPLMRGESSAQVLNFLCADGDPVTRLLALCAVGESFAQREMLPAAQAALNDKDADARQAACFAYERCSNREAAMPQIIKQVQRLRGFPIFSGLGIRELRAVASIAEVLRPPRESVIVRRGEAFAGVYLVIEGSVAELDSQGRQAGQFEPGGMFGMFGLFLDQVAEKDYVAAREARLFFITSASFLEMMKLYPLIGVNLCRYFSGLLTSGECLVS